MSAFLISDSHIDVMLTYAAQHRLTLPDPRCPSSSIDVSQTRNATLIGQTLLRENLRSLACRYGAAHGFTPEPHNDESYAERYQFKPDDRLASLGSDISVAIMKLTHCFDYQACETNNYASTPAAAITLALREAAAYQLPGYDKAPWSIADHPDG
jgi:hypothetical protein